MGKINDYEILISNQTLDDIIYRYHHNYEELCEKGYIIDNKIVKNIDNLIPEIWELKKYLQYIYFNGRCNDGWYRNLPINLSKIVVQYNLFDEVALNFWQQYELEQNLKELKNDKKFSVTDLYIMLSKLDYKYKETRKSLALLYGKDQSKELFSILKLYQDKNMISYVAFMIISLINYKKDQTIDTERDAYYTISNLLSKIEDRKCSKSEICYLFNKYLSSDFSDIASNYIDVKTNGDNNESNINIFRFFWENSLFELLEKKEFIDIVKSTEDCWKFKYDKEYPQKVLNRLRVK